MASVTKAVKALQGLPSTDDTLANADFEQADSVVDERSVIASHQPDRAIAVAPGEYNLDLVAYESFTTDGSAGDAETFDLAHDPLDSDSVPQDVVVYKVGTGYVQPDSVDYDADTFTYTDGGTNNDLHVFYVAGAQATAQVRKVSPGGSTSEVLDEADVGILNRRNQNKRPLRFDFDHPLQGVVPANWTLEVVVDAPYIVSWGVDTNNDGALDAQATNQLINAPIRRTRQHAPDFVEGVVAAVAAQR